MPSFCKVELIVINVKLQTSKWAELSVIFYIYWLDRNIRWIWMRLTAWYTVTVLSTDLREKREWHLKGMSQTSSPWPLCAVKLSLSACWHIVDEKYISSEIISKQTSRPALIYHGVLLSADVCDYTAPSSGERWNCKAAFMDLADTYILKSTYTLL